MIVAILIPVAVAAEVVRVEITGREVVSDAPEHMRSGPYEVIRGIVHLEVDPDNPANRRIVDLQLADRNRRGKVEFSADFELHKPVNPVRGNRRLLYFVNNRGNKFGSYHFVIKGGIRFWKNWKCPLPCSLCTELRTFFGHGEDKIGRQFVFAHIAL